MNVELTDAILELGWEPPAFRTQWDVLPLVTMAEGDDPVITPLSQDIFPLVHVKHPHYGLQFEKLGLRWVPSPALSRLGFDIGGVQYTATPFMGTAPHLHSRIIDMLIHFRLVYGRGDRCARPRRSGEVQRASECC